MLGSNEIYPSYCLNIAKACMYVHYRARNAWKVEKRGIENMENYIDVCRNIQQTERIMERWMMR